MRCLTPEEWNYFTINTPAKWREGLSDSVFVDGDGRLGLTPMLNLNLFGDDGQATGLAIDSQGNLFIIEAEHCQLYRRNGENQMLQRLECLEGCESGKDRPPGFDWRRRHGKARGLFGCGSGTGKFKFKKDGQASGGLAFGRSTLYITDPFNHRVQAFYLPQFQIRLVLGKRADGGSASGDGEGEFDHPKDIVTDSKDNFYVLDYGNRRIQKFNRAGRFLLAFRDAGEGTLQQPESLGVDKDNFLYVVDSGKSTVEKFNSRGEWQGTAVDWLKDIPELLSDPARPTVPSAVAVDKNGVIYVGERGEGGGLRIHLFDQNHRYLGHFGSYRDGCYKLIVDGQGRLYATCGAKGEVLIFGGDGNFEKAGNYYSKIFDSTIEECQWHRLALDIEPAEKSTLVVSCRASDQLFDQNETEDKLPWQPLMSTPHQSGAVNDALFAQIAGRFLQLRFTFSGDGLHTHKVRKAQIYFQRLSYLRYLPATYQEDAQSRDFLERFLSIFESLSYEIEQEIAGVARYFDPEVVTGEFLDWLGTWIAVMRDYNWPEEKRRALLEKAFPLYRRRGTMRGLREMVELFTGGETAIIEHHRLQTPMVLSANATLGLSTVVGKSFTKKLVLEESSRIGEFALIETAEPPEKPFAVNAFDFTLIADTSKLESEAQMQALRRLVEEEKPAHTRCFLRVGGTVMQVGMHAVLQVDTKLAKGFETARLGVSSQIGKGTFLGTKYRRRGVIGARSTLTVDAVLH